MEGSKDGGNEGGQGRGEDVYRWAYNLKMLWATAPFYDFRVDLFFNFFYKI